MKEIQKFHLALARFIEQTIRSPKLVTERSFNYQLWRNVYDIFFGSGDLAMAFTVDRVINKKEIMLLAGKISENFISLSSSVNNYENYHKIALIFKKKNDYFIPVYLFYGEQIKNIQTLDEKALLSLNKFRADFEIQQRNARTRIYFPVEKLVRHFANFSTPQEKEAFEELNKLFF